jgi:hypothetical protein
VGKSSPIPVRWWVGARAWLEAWLGKEWTGRQGEHPRLSGPGFLPGNLSSMDLSPISQNFWLQPSCLQLLCHLTFILCCHTFHLFQL